MIQRSGLNREFTFRYIEKHASILSTCNLQIPESLNLQFHNSRIPKELSTKSLTLMTKPVQQPVQTDQQ
jgi:hypothetical protein